MSGRWIVLAACAAAGLCRAAGAQNLKAVEFTPFYGYSFSGGFEDDDTLIESEGGALTVEIASDTLWQAQLQAGVIFAF